MLATELQEQKHKHSNLTVLNTITADMVSKYHYHSNLILLNKLTLLSTVLVYSNIALAII